MTKRKIYQTYVRRYRPWKKMATVENCSLADRMDRVYEKD
jgi:hypothetical protein